MHQPQLKVTHEIFNIKKVEARLKEISTVLTNFREGLLKVAEKVQRQLTWIEANATFP